MAQPIRKLRPGTQITSEVLYVTPALAKQWLADNNTHNREFSELRVQTYAGEMRAGRWQFNGETLQFDINDVLLNGQHRLSAIVRSGIAQTFLIVRGLDPRVQITIDQGTRRKPAEQMLIAGITADNSTAAAGRVYLQWITGRLYGDRLRRDVSTGELVEWATDSHDEWLVLRALASTSLLQIPAQPSVVYAARFRFHLISPEEAVEFFRGLTLGADLPATSPILALRNRLLKAKAAGEKLSRRDILGYFTVAWNAYRARRPLARMSRPQGGWTVETFPEPK